MDWEAQDEGVIAKIIAPDGTKDIPVGTVVAVVVDDAEHVSTELPFVFLMTPAQILTGQIRPCHLGVCSGACAFSDIFVVHAPSQLPPPGVIVPQCDGLDHWQWLLNIYQVPLASNAER